MALWRDDIDAVAFRPAGGESFCLVHRLAFRTLIGRQPAWLDPSDQLDVATRTYLEARQTLHETRLPHEDDDAWAAARATRTREDASRRSTAARATARQLLEERQVLASARAAGLTVVG